MHGCLSVPKPVHQESNIETRRDIVSPEILVIDSCKLPHRYRELSLGLLEKHPWSQL